MDSTKPGNIDSASNLINVIIYLASGTAKLNNKETVGFVGGYGYTYDHTIPGRKKLAKDVTTTVGYYTGDQNRSDTVVNDVDIITSIVPNVKTELESIFITLKHTLSYFDNDTHNNVAIILKNKYVPLLLSDKDNCKVLEKLNVDDNTITLIKDVKEIISRYLIKNKIVWFDLDGSVTGGMGNKRAQDQCDLAEIFSTWDTSTDIIFTVTDTKTYNNPVNDFNKIVSAGRWYFNTGSEHKFYEDHNGYRRYDFGKIDPLKKYYGKATPNATYGSLFTKSPITLLDKLYEYAKVKLKNPNELMLAGKLQYVKSKDISRLIDVCPGVKKGKDLVVPYRVGSDDDEPTLVELIDPPGLSYRIVVGLDELGIFYNSFISRDENNTHGNQTFINITDSIYAKEVNGKGIVKLKLAESFKMNTQVIVVGGFHPKVSSRVPLMLAVGYDLPDRNNFGSVTDTNVEVWCGLEFSNDKCIIYRTVTKTDGWIYVHSSSCANVRVLNKNELNS